MEDQSPRSMNSVGYSTHAQEQPAQENVELQLLTPTQQLPAKIEGGNCESEASDASDCVRSLASEACAKRTARKVFLCVGIVLVWMVMILPTVMFYVPQDSSDSLVTSDASTCGNREVYVGETCRETLQDLQSCLLGDQGDGTVYIPSTDGRQDEIEAQAKILVSYLPLLRPSQECEEAVMPLLCLYLFKLCTGEGNGTLHQLSSQQCSIVRADTCSSEWRTAEMLLDRGTLPDCSSLPVAKEDDLLVCHNNDTGSASATGSGSGMLDLTSNSTDTETGDNSTTSGRMCSDNFFDDGRICQPECGEWEEWSSVTVDTIDGFVILAAVTDIIATTIILVISCIHYKRMLKFPTSILFYQSIGLFVMGVLILVAYMDRKGLFCSSQSLLSSFYNPTAFCTISGVAFGYVMFQLMFWWLCHSVMVFWTIKFPFHYRTFSQSRELRYVHITVVVMGVIIPVVPVGVTFATGEFVVTRFPPIACLPDNKDAIFYSTALPVSIMIAVGVSLLILVLNELLEMIQKRDQTRIAQAKILIVLVFYILVGVSVLTTFTVSTKNFQRSINELSIYFACESQGTGETCDTSGFRKYSNPIPEALSFVLLGLIPVVKLIYVIKFRNVKGSYQKWRGRKDKTPSGDSSTSNSSASSRRQLSTRMDRFR